MCRWIASIGESIFLEDIASSSLDNVVTTESQSAELLWSGRFHDGLTAAVLTES